MISAGIELFGLSTLSFRAAWPAADAQLAAAVSNAGGLGISAMNLDADLRGQIRGAGAD